MATSTDSITPSVTEDQFWEFWVKGQQQGFAGKLPRIKLPDGSKITVLYEHPLIYTDRWYGSDSGGGQTLVHVLRWQWDERQPLSINGTPLARMGYSGQVVDWGEEELKQVILESQQQAEPATSIPNFYHSTPLGLALSERCKRLYVKEPKCACVSPKSDILTNPPSSEQLWGFLKTALSQASRTCLFRGPSEHTHQDYPEFEYSSKEVAIGPGFHQGTEMISYKGLRRFQGVYDFVLVKKNLGDQLFGK